MDDIFKKYDKRVLRNKDGLVKFSKSIGYKHYSEMIFYEMKIRSAKSIIDDMKDFGLDVYPAVQTVWTLNKKLNDEHKDHKPQKRICSKCGKKEVPPENWRYCNKCKISNFLMASTNDVESYSVNYAGSY